MNLKYLVAVLTLCVTCYGQRYRCNRKSALLLLKRPSYEFSVKILERVSLETREHFVYSPLSTWVQLTALAEGAKGPTLREIWKVTKHHRMPCFRRKLGDILRKLNRILRKEMKNKSLMVFDELMGIKSKYVKAVQKFGIKVLTTDFNDPIKSASKVNQLIAAETNEVIPEVIDYEDFKSTVLLLSDATFFRSFWKSPFNRSLTTLEPFYSDKNIKIGEVKMMNQIGYFNYTEFPLISAKVLEIPCADDRLSMYIFLPTRNNLVDLFFYLKYTRITAIFNKFKSEGLKLVDVKIPRFKITTDIDNIPELVYDMGIRRIFNPDKADFKGISDYKIYASGMFQVADIEVSEEGVLAKADVGFLNYNYTRPIKFHANKPFGFMIVDRETEFIIFAGMYSKPKVF